MGGLHFKHSDIAFPGVSPRDARETSRVLSELDWSIVKQLQRNLLAEARAAKKAARDSGNDVSSVALGLAMKRR
jgi:hypothetical protein